MSLFGNFKNETIIPHRVSLEALQGAPLLENASLGALSLPNNEGAIAYTTDRGVALSDHDIANQFIMFQVSDKIEGPRILDSSQVEPKLKGSSDRPDMLAKIQLMAFNVGENEDVDKGTRATMRINFGKDKNSNSHLDTLFWSVASGLNLYNDVKGKKARGAELEADINKALGNRPIEIPGSLGELQFEVVKHREPKWWKKIFQFIQSGTGKALTSTIGFPAITHQAVDVLDELLDRLDKSKPEILFKSRPMTLALSEKAKSEVTGGIPWVKAPSLNPGYCILARGRDYPVIVENSPDFYLGYKKLVPGGIAVNDVVSGNYDDPFRDITYAVFRVGMQETRLDPTLNFG